MKKNVVSVLLLLLFLCCISPLSIQDAQAAEANAPVTVSFQANGGTGTMGSLTVQPGVSAALSKNTYSRTGFTFVGWNTRADGTGTGYADMADVSGLAAEAGEGQSVVLYAQWKLNAPKIKKLKKASAVTVKVTYAKKSYVDGYEIQYGTKANFKKAITVTAPKSSSGKVLTDPVPGKNCYVRMRGYYSNNGVRSYSDWSKAKKIKLKKASVISNTKSEATIEADVTLTGSGTGYHAKLVICTQTSAVSFGIQYDSCAAAPYTGKAMALVENVANNMPGGQTYTRPGNKSLKLGKTYHMMLTVNKNGKGSVYLDYKKIGDFSNAGLANQFLYLRVEGSARLNGDRLNAVFRNIKCKTGGAYLPDKVWTTATFPSCPTIHSKVKKDGSIVISGSVSGLPAGGDWDSHYEKVSGIRQFIQ